MKNILKKILIFMIANLVFISISNALDYSNIEFSDSIKIEDNDKITIKLPINYKNNNSKIDYQLIETSKETIDEYESKSIEILQNLATQHNECVISNENDASSFSQLSECLTFLEQANIELYSYLPDFDDGKWIIKDFNNFDETNVIYEIDNNLDEYNWIWIRAKDDNGNTIYQISSIAPKSNDKNDETIADTTNDTNNNSTVNNISKDTYEIPDTAINSKIVKLIGSCFLVCGLVVLYLYFKNKDKKE